jgi:hypothetical protein
MYAVEGGIEYKSYVELTTALISNGLGVLTFNDTPSVASP